LMILAIILSWLLSLPITASAGQGHAILQSSPAMANSASHRGVKPSRPVPRRDRSRHPTMIIFPHPSAYYLPPTGVVASPYFCVFHNEAFVSRIGMIDHLSSMHGVSLTTAAALCPDANGNCIFPLY
jgi:hypothetical protein